MKKYYEFEIISERRIIREKAYGVWTKEIAEQFLQDFKKAAKPLLGDSWAKLVDLKDWKTSQQDTVDIVAKHLEWARTHGMAYSANIIPSATARMQVRRMMQQGGTSDFSDVFETEDAALEWLKENGF
jgi:hypothetical protein